MSSAQHCRKSEDLQRFLLGQLPAEDSEQVQQHLAACPRCLDTVSHLQAGDTLIEAMRAQANATSQPEADVVEDLIGKLSGLYRKTESSAFEATSPGSSGGTGFNPSSPESLSFLAPPCAPDELGRLGGYRILKVLGAGGMGIVFEAEDPQLQRRVALKVMRPELAARLADRQRFLREARAMAAIEHDHIVAIYQVGEDRGVPFLAMQMLKGETLADRLRRVAAPPLPPGEATREAGAPGERSRSPTTLPIAEVLRIGREVAAGLAAAHAQGLTHRDVKPPNVWLEKSGRVKILDFGLARPVQDDAHLTQSGLIAGTPQYMAPEQATGQAVDHLSDLFSLGCVLYRITTGRLPFRGPNALAILRSLALEQPPPPREVRPEAPRALSDLTMRLLAKDPHKRPQSADAVVETLTEIGREAARQDAPTKSASQRMRFLAAAVALLVLGPIAAWYAPAVYRIATNQGLLIIQSNDEDVEVTVTQNGEKVKIVDRKTGQEVTLKAGTYQVELSGSKQAGLTLETDHVTLTRGGIAVVKVWREPPVASPTPSVKPVAPAPLPFVVINGSSGTETTFATLLEAAAAAKNGDTIEIRGNGPFESPTITIGTQALAIRAGTGFEPVLQIDAQSLAAGLPLLDTWAPLVLEGLHFRLVEDTPGMDGQYQLIVSHNAPFSATHCRFFLKSSRLVSALWLANSPLVQVRHCEFGGVLNAAIHWPSLTSSHEMEVSDCVCWGANSMVVCDQPSDLTLRLHRNTFVGNTPVVHYYRQLPQPPAEPSLRPLRIDARGNVFDSNTVLILQVQAPGKFQPAVDQPLLPRSMAWSESKNQYGGNLLLLSGQGESVWAVTSLEEWQSYWGLKDAGSLQGKVLYQGGDVRTRKSAEPDTLALADFRLHADSPGKGAGEGGRDLGANVDQIGPGRAYEAWKKTPDYQEWQIATGQVREMQPFVVKSAGGKREFKFSHLAEAVTAARSGDTIEIRANGPFVTEPAKITGKALTLRAGQGFAPVIQLSPAAIKTGATLLETDAALRVEGLEFHRVGTDELPDEFVRNVLLSQRSPLYMANCRFLMQGRMSQNYAAQAVESPRWEVRNCFFSGGPLNALYWGRPPQGQMIVENCLISTNNYGLVVSQQGFDSGEGSVRLVRNTFLAGCPFSFNFAEKNTTLDPAAGPTLVEASGNIFDAGRFALFAQYFQERRPLEFKAGQTRLHELLAWRDQRNLYRVFEEYLSIQYSYPPPLQIEHGLKGLAEWQAFWEAKDTGSVEGIPHYQGALPDKHDLNQPQELRAEDFRLQAGSPGQGAGEGGRDLGADVTLVGPGPAYEYWKKTPEYQEWLKNSSPLTP